METRAQRQTRTIDARFQVREDEGERRLEGYFSVFGGVYELWPGATESIDPHAFDGALGDDIRVLINHETRLVLGRTVAGTAELRTDDKGLWGSVAINAEDQDAMNLYARVKRGDVSQASFGFDILEEETTETREGDGSWSVHWTIKRVKLYEVSVVTFPAYRDTEIEARVEDLRALRARRMDEYKTRMLGRIAAASKREV